MLRHGYFVGERMSEARSRIHLYGLAGDFERPMSNQEMQFIGQASCRLEVERYHAARLPGRRLFLHSKCMCVDTRIIQYLL